MQKDELIQLHSFLLQLKNNLETISDNYDESLFDSYNTLNVSPIDIYKSKNHHKLAIFTISRDISNILRKDNRSLFQKIYDNLEKLCNYLRDLFNFK